MLPKLIATELSSLPKGRSASLWECWQLGSGNECGCTAWAEKRRMLRVPPPNNLHKTFVLVLQYV